MAGKHFFGASIDGIISYEQEGVSITKILEIKCPYSFKDKSLCESGNNLTYLSDGELKKSSSYYTQIQFYMGVYNIEDAILFIWCPRDSLHLDIRFDQTFYRDMMIKLERIYKDIYAPLLFN